MKYGRDRGRRLAPPSAIPTAQSLFRQALLRAGIPPYTCDDEGVPGALRSTALQLRAARRVLRRSRGPLRARLGRLDERLVFIVGSPRSGTTFLGRAIGSLPGFVDLGEVAALKASVPELASCAPDEGAPRLRRLLALTGRLGLAGGLRAVEHTPENAFVAEALSLAFPEARFVHPVRDGRDVVASLLERGWLSEGRGGGDDAGLPYGPKVRFWVEPERAEEFDRAGDARRAAWAWRRYIEAARSLPERTLELRYEELAAQPDVAAARLAPFLGVEEEALRVALSEARVSAVGRYRRDLSRKQLAEVEAECGDLLRELRYLQTV
jgi:Sulfotransferase family